MPDQDAKRKKWTLMFYLASDNPLAPGVISQLKAIKAAGWHKQANVIVQFDPYTEDTPTHVFDVNLVRKLKSGKEHDIGFHSDDSFVPNLVEDKLWRDEVDRDDTPIRDRLMKTIPGYAPDKPPNGVIMSANGHAKEPGPQKSLKNFLEFCADSYPAEHYILFILGHGVVVGNDVFLFDEHGDEQTLTLGGLRGVLHDFKKRVNKKDPLEMVSFHSCSVSSVEVAYELKDVTRYMLASQATTYVGNWPYRQILIRIFNSLKPDRQHEPTEEILRDLFSYCLHNSKDFLLAGYPYDICLSRLGAPMAEAKAEIDKLAGALIKGVETFREEIVKAHLKAQSFQNELYTDLIDFCRCLFQTLLDPASAAKDDSIAAEIMAACRSVIRAVENCIDRASFAGPEYQYARGFSIYFPWSKPSDALMMKYSKYTFAVPNKNSWFGFLEAYFRTTMRDTIKDESAHPIPDLDVNTGTVRPASKDEELFEDQLALVYTQAASQSSPFALEKPIKTDSGDPMGGCGCASIKNYPRDTRRLKERKKPLSKGFAIKS